MPEVVGDSSTKTPSPPGLPQSGKKNGKKPKPFRFIYMEPVPKSTFRPWNAQAIQVRSHVMKRYHHHRKAKEQSHTEGENAAPVQSAASGSSEEPGFELRSDSHKQFSTNTAAYQDRDVHGRSQEQNENGRMIALFSERGWFSPDPVEILGAGRVDPFRSYPVNDTSSCFPELLDHAISQLWPGLYPTNITPRAWFSKAITDPLSFRAVTFASWVHLDYLRNAKVNTTYIVPLSLRYKLIHELNKSLQAQDQRGCSDAILQSVLALATDGTADVRRVEYKSPFQSPLRSLQWLNVYGSVNFVGTHIKAIRDMVALRGGLGRLELFGLAETLVLADLIHATKTLSRPLFPLLENVSIPGLSVGIYSANRSQTPTLGHDTAPSQGLGSGFSDLNRHGVPLDAIAVFVEMAETTLAIDDYLQGRHGSLAIDTIASKRNSVQQRLLYLPRVCDAQLDVDESDPSNAIYDCCGLAALIYSVAVIFPISTPEYILGTLVQRLKSNLELSIDQDCWIGLEDLFLWVLVLGGIAAVEQPQRSWFVDQMTIITVARSLGNFEAVLDILESFLWLESACGMSGRMFWAEAVKGQKMNNLVVDLRLISTQLDQLL